MQAPCKNCPDRQLGCHSTCEKYIAFDKYRKEILAKKDAANREKQDIYYRYWKEQKRRKRW